jgi:hypothetical protein
MSSPNGSIANLSVTRKTLGASIDNNSDAGVLFFRLLARFCQSQPGARPLRGFDGRPKQKAGASTAPASVRTIFFAAWRLSPDYFWMLA